MISTTELLIEKLREVAVQGDTDDSLYVTIEDAETIIHRYAEVAPYTRESIKPEEVNKIVERHVEDLLYNNWDVADAIRRLDKNMKSDDMVVCKIEDLIFIKSILKYLMEKQTNSKSKSHENI